MKKVTAILGAVALSLAVRTWGAGAQQCQVHVLVPITDDMGNSWKPGAILPVDIERDNADGGSYCAHGGSCLPRRVNGSDALALMNCKTGPALGGGDFRLLPGPRPARLAGSPVLRDDQECHRSRSGIAVTDKIR